MQNVHRRAVLERVCLDAAAAAVADSQMKAIEITIEVQFFD
jgi:hypothetical protein